MTPRALVDTSVLVGLNLRTESPRAEQARALIRGRDHLVMAPQCLYELYAVLTRGRAENGIGYQPSEAWEVMDELAERFEVLPDPPDLLRLWREVLVQDGVIGKRSHDARLVAFARGWGIGEVLTLNARDFARLGLAVRTAPDGSRMEPDV